MRIGLILTFLFCLLMISTICRSSFAAKLETPAFIVCLAKALDNQSQVKIKTFTKVQVIDENKKVIDSISATYAGGSNNDLLYFISDTGFFAIDRKKLDSSMSHLEFEKQPTIKVQKEGVCAAHAVVNCIRSIYAAEKSIPHELTVFFDDDQTAIDAFVRFYYENKDLDLPTPDHLIVQPFSRWSAIADSFRHPADYKLKYAFIGFGLKARFSVRWEEFRRHLESGGRALLGIFTDSAKMRIRLVKSPLELLQSVPYLKDATRPRKRNWLRLREAIIQGDHAVAVTGLIKSPNGKSYAMVLDSHLGEVQFWDMNELEDAFRHGGKAILVEK
jgi:hypothetical protein